MADDRTTWTIEFKEQGLDGTTRKVEVFQDSLGRLREVNGRFASEQIKADSAVHSMPQSLPQPGHRRPFEVVDAEAEGLRPGAVFTALLGRVLNPNC